MPAVQCRLRPADGGLCVAADMGSRNLSPQIRQAIFYDVVRKDVDARFSTQPDDQGEPDRSHPMWWDWSEQVREVAAAQQARTAKL